MRHIEHPRSWSEIRQLLTAPEDQIWFVSFAAARGVNVETDESCDVETAYQDWLSHAASVAHVAAEFATV